jgi:transcriptional regulator with XRE-family HTH domain
MRCEWIPRSLVVKSWQKRKEKGWSQEQLGEMAEISRNYVSKLSEAKLIVFPSK